MRIVCLLVLALGCTLALGCHSPQSVQPVAEAPARPAADSVQLEQIRPGVWVHTTYRDVEGFGLVRSSGLAVVAGEDALLVDTGWSEDPEAATRQIVRRLEADGVRVERAVLAHYHDDSVAGIAALHEAGIRTYATHQTADLMEADGWGRPDSLFAEEGDVWTLSVGDQTVEVFYPGGGHTLDNVVVYVPHARVLYGGCLIRPGGTTSLGNTADADVEAWAETVGRVRTRYGDRIEIVVPSHGPPGGAGLLDATIRLVEEQRAAAGGQ